MVNVVFLEMITSRDPGAGGLITLAQFTFVTLVGLPDVMAWGGNRGIFKQRGMPLWFHAFITATFFTVSLLNNMALKYQIAMPLHMVFRASSLAASLLLGYLAFGKRYEAHQVRGVLLVSIGIFIATWADAQQKQEIAGQAALGADCCNQNQFTESNDAVPDGAINELTNNEVDKDPFHQWLFGLGLLTIALFLSAALGHFQERGYQKWGKHSVELKFYSHAMALPWFVVFRGQDIFTHAQHWITSPSLADTLASQGGIANTISTLLPPTLANIPLLWWLLLGNVLSQLVCISHVYRLTAVSSTLTCTMTITFRKFLSIIFSVVYFQNPFSLKHWTGTCLVFLGVGFYSGLIALPKAKSDKTTKVE